MTTSRGNETKAQDMAIDTVTGQDVGRRHFLKWGGVAAVVATAAACVEPKEVTQIPETGTRIPPPSTSVPPNPGTPVLNATLVLTALSVERLIVDVYNEILGKGWLSSPGVPDLIRRLLSHHRSYAEFLAAEATAMGQDAAAVKPNAGVQKDLVTSQIEAIAAVAGDKTKAETESMSLVRQLEDTAAQLYARAGGEMTEPRLRQRMVSIGAITAKHYSVAATASSAQPVPFAFERTAPVALPVDSYVPADKQTVRTVPAVPGQPARPSSAGTAPTSR